MPANSSQFPSSAPIWGLGTNALITDIITQSYKTDRLDAEVLAITPSDVTIIDPVIHSLELGTAGNVAIVTLEGETATLTALAAGVVHKLPFRIKQIKATGTTATGIVGFAG